MLLGWVLRWVEGYGQEEVDRGAVDLRGRLAVVLGQELLDGCVSGTSGTCFWGDGIVLAPGTGDCSQLPVSDVSC